MDERRSASPWGEAFQDAADVWWGYWERAATDGARQSAELWWEAAESWWSPWWAAGRRSTVRGRALPQRGFRRTDEGAWAIGESGQVELAVSDLHSTLQRIFGPEHAGELAATAARVRSLAGDARPVIIAWVDLIEILVFETESRHPRAAGKIKLAEVRAVVGHLVAKGELVLHLPPAVEHLVTDVVTDWIVDAIVHAANRYGWWPEVRERRSLLRRIGAAAAAGWRWLTYGVTSAMTFLPYLIRRLWRRTRPSPRLAAALRKLEQAERGDVSPDDAVRTLAEIVEWVAKHRQELTASIEVVFAAVEEAERFAELDEFEKKWYAHDLLIFLLEDIGFDTKVGLLATVSESVIDTTLDAVFHLFSKHGVSAGRLVS